MEPNKFAAEITLKFIVWALFVPTIAVILVYLFWVSTVELDNDQIDSLLRILLIIGGGLSMFLTLLGHILSTKFKSIWHPVLSTTVVTFNMCTTVFVYAHPVGRERFIGYITNLMQGIR